MFLLFHSICCLLDSFIQSPQLLQITILHQCKPIKSSCFNVTQHTWHYQSRVCACVRVCKLTPAFPRGGTHTTMTRPSEELRYIEIWKMCRITTKTQNNAFIIHMSLILQWDTKEQEAKSSHYRKHVGLCFTTETCLAPHTIGTRTECIAAEKQNKNMFL